jgi:hypothetical protein
MIDGSSLEISMAIELCLTPGSCEGCPFLDADQCHEALLKGALDALNQQDATIGYLTELNAKLAEELKNSMFLQGKEDDG